MAGLTRDEVARLAVLAREADFLGPDTRAWVERLAPERERLAEAVRLLAKDGEDVSAAGIAANVWRLWLLSGDVAGGRELLAVALDVEDPRPSRERALALYGDGLLAFRAGAQDESRRRNEDALECARSVGDVEAESLALVGLSRVAFRDGDYDAVRSLALEARDLVRELPPEAGIAPLHLLAAGTRLAGELDAAVALYEQSLELNRRLGDARMVGMELHNIGHVELHRGNEPRAAECFAEAAQLRSADDPYDIAMGNLNQAALAVARGDRDRAAELIDRMQATLDGAGIVLDPDDGAEVAWIRGRLGSAG